MPITRPGSISGETRKVDDRLAPGEAAAHQGDGAERAEHHGDRGRDRRDLQRGDQRRQQAARVGQPLVPAQRPVGRRQGEDGRGAERHRDGDDERRHQEDHGEGRDEPDDVARRARSIAVMTCLPGGARARSSRRRWRRPAPAG